MARIKICNFIFSTN